MKLITLFLIVLTFDISWQEESTETLNETLDRLIKQTNLGDHEESNSVVSNYKNNSRVFYLNSQDINKESETTSTVPNVKIDDNNQVSVRDILQALGFGSSKSAANDDHNAGSTKNIKEITVTHTINDPTTRITSTDSGEATDLLEQYTSKSGRPVELDDSSLNAFLNLAAATDTNLLHKYPEIIIDKITYHDDKKKAEAGVKIKSVTHKVDQSAEKQNNYPLAVAQELKTLFDELQKMKATETAKEMSSQRNDKTHMTPVQISQDETPCSNELVPYSSPCKSLLLSKLLEYQNLLNTDPGIDTSLQLNIWGARNARQNAIVRISRAQKLKRIHYITHKINNMMPGFVYRPLHSYY